MTDRPASRILLACLTAAIGCDDAPALAPPESKRGPSVPAPSIGGLAVTPASVTLRPGATVQLTVRAYRADGGRPATDVAIVYASDAPAIARVDDRGLVTGIAEGSATIYATATIGGQARRRAMITHVLSPADTTDLVLTAGASGWYPDSASVPVGSVVRWWGSPGTRHTTLYLLTAEWKVVDSLEMGRGGVTRRLDVAGPVRYCSGPCWDPSDFGVVHVADPAGG